jgi:anti-anti-sigma factor
MSAAVTVRAEGELTIYEVARLKDQWLGRLGAAPAFELDLGGVTEIDGAGLQLLVHLQREAQRSGCTLRLLAPSPAVIEAFDLCGLAGLQEASS